MQLTPAADLAFLAPKLATITQLPLSAMRLALQRPGGVILENLTAADVTRLRRQIRRTQGMKSVQSNMNGLTDLFVINPLPASVSRQLGRYLALMGASSCRFSGALAAGLTRQQAKHICARPGGY